MRLARLDLVPRPGLLCDETELLQRRVTETAVFMDDLPLDLAVVLLASPETEHQTLAKATTLDADVDPPSLVAGINQSSPNGRVLGVVVVLRGGEVIKRTHVIPDFELSYIPGLLSLHEGGPILDVLIELDCDPGLPIFNGSGRIHLRQAGLATHPSVVCDAPSIGVAKSLLCGTLDEGVNGRPEGWRTPIRADDSAGIVGGHPAGSKATIGYASQSRQYNPRPVVNPLYVSPDHHLFAAMTIDLASRLSGLYELPEPTRLADAYVDEAKVQYED